MLLLIMNTEKMWVKANKRSIRGLWVRVCVYADEFDVCKNDV